MKTSITVNNKIFTAVISTQIMLKTATQMENYNK